MGQLSFFEVLKKETPAHNSVRVMMPDAAGQSQ